MAEERNAWHIETALLPEGWAQDVRVEFASGAIRSVTTGQARAPTDVAIAIGLPGVPNLHSHAFQRAMAGLTEVKGPADDSFWTWREVMYRFVECLTPDTIGAIAALAYMEMLEAGFVRVGEFHYLHHGPDGTPYANPAETGARIAAAAEMAGIGLTLLPVFYAHSAFGGAPPDEAQRRFVCDPDSYGRLVEASRAALAALPGALVGIAPHSLRAVTPDELAAILGIGDGPVHIHVSEQVREVEDCLAWSGVRPVQWLLDNVGVGERWCLVHAIHVDEEETRRLAASKAVVGLCPITEANLGDGLFPAEAFLRHGGRIGIGTDSNVRVDMAEELRLLEYGQRLSTRSRNVLAGGSGRSTGRRLFDAAVAGGAQSLGAKGGLKVGASADLVTLDPGAAALAARSGDQILDSLIFGGGAGTIADVWRAGRCIVKAGRHVRREAIVASYRSAVAGLAL